MVKLVILRKSLLNQHWNYIIDSSVYYINCWLDFLKTVSITGKCRFFLYIRFFIPGKRGNAFADDGRTLTSHVNTAVSAALQQDWSTWRRSQILSRYACRYSGKDFFISFQFILRQKIHRNSNAIIFFNLKNKILNFLEEK